MFKPNTKNLKVLTPDGYKLCDGIQKVEKELVELLFDCGKTIKCSKNHQLCIDLFKFVFKQANELNVGDKVFGADGIYTINDKRDIGIIELYDIVNVHDTLCYYTNGILSHNCKFLNDGVAAISDELFKQLESTLKPPQWSFDNGEYKIWKEPNLAHVYVAGVDVGDGIGQNASVIQILDITDLGQIEQVAEYWCNTISPALFVHKAHEILMQWGKPLLLIERNGCGGIVVDNLIDMYDYPFIVNWGVEKYEKIRTRTYNRNGVVSHTNVKFAAIQNMRYWTNDIRAVIINSKDLVLELKTFTRQDNGTWKANPGKLDDRVMLYVWALNMLDTQCCQGFFEILDTDKFGKPKEMIPNYDLYDVKTRVYSIKEIEGGPLKNDDETDLNIPEVVMGEATHRSKLTRWVDLQTRKRDEELMRMQNSGWTIVQPNKTDSGNNNNNLGWNLLRL